jgi:hypothetical protein
MSKRRLKKTQSFVLRVLSPKFLNIKRTQYVKEQKIFTFLGFSQTREHRSRKRKIHQDDNYSYYLSVFHYSCINVIY